MLRTIYMNRCSVCLSLLFVVLSVTFFAGAGCANQQLPDFFLEIARSATTQSSSFSKHGRRKRPVSINFSALQNTQPSRLSSVPESGDSVLSDSKKNGDLQFQPISMSIRFFNDLSLTVNLTGMKNNRSGSVTWFGEVDGKRNSLVTLVAKDGLMTGNIVVGSNLYQIRPAVNYGHELIETNLASFTPEADPLTVEPPTAQLQAVSSEPLSGNVIVDIMVAYTTEARIAAGGLTEINNLIDLAVAETNITYLNSGISQLVNLVHTVEVNYPESGTIVTDRNHLQDPDDGVMDEIHTLRDQYQADLVLLLVADGGGFCGVAYSTTSVSNSFAEYGFCVVDADCATSVYSFGHELGHLMGARHEWYYDSVDNSPFTYNHAYVDTTNQWRTVMANGKECSDNGYSCPRIPYWSNPDLDYMGAPLGISEGEPLAADHRKTLNNTALTIAGFRMSDSSISPSCSLMTTVETSHEHDGIMFDIRAKQNTTIHGFSTLFDTAGTVSRIEVYYRSGSYLGFSKDPGAWVMTGSMNNVPVQAAPSQTHIPIDMNISIPAGNTYSFYITVTDHTSEPALAYLEWTPTGSAFAEDTAIEVLAGLGKAYPFSSSFINRIFSGTIHHSCPVAYKSLQTAEPTRGDNGIMFDVRAKRNLTIHGFASYFDLGTVNKLEIYYRPGSHVGFEKNSEGWTLIGSINNVIGSNPDLIPPLIQSRIPIDLQVVIPAGQTGAFYITADAEPNLNYYVGTAVGSIAASNSYLDLLEGTGKRAIFGDSFTPRVFSGTIYFDAELTLAHIISFLLLL